MINLSACPPASAVNLWLGRSAGGARLLFFLPERPAQFKDKVSSDMPDYFPWWDERAYE